MTEKEEYKLVITGDGIYKMQEMTEKEIEESDEIIDIIHQNIGRITNKLIKED